jgi:hypothetical protein
MPSAKPQRQGGRQNRHAAVRQKNRRRTQRLERQQGPHLGQRMEQQCELLSRPTHRKFERYAMPRESANVPQIPGRAGEVWLPESGTEHISVIRIS